MVAEKEDTKKEADAKATKVRDRDVTPPAPPPTRPQPHDNFWRQISPRSQSRKSSTSHHHAHHAITHEPASDRPYSTIVTPTAG